jgi:hypothetical protein
MVEKFSLRKEHKTLKGGLSEKGRKALVIRAWDF